MPVAYDNLTHSNYFIQSITHLHTQSCRSHHVVQLSLDREEVKTVDYDSRCGEEEEDHKEDYIDDHCLQPPVTVSDRQISPAR